MSGLDKLLTVEDVAEWLGVSTAWVYDHARGRRKPSIPTVRLGSSVRFRRESVQRFLEESEQNEPAA